MPAVQGGKDCQVRTVPGDVRCTRWQRLSGEDCPSPDARCTRLQRLSGEDCPSLVMPAVQGGKDSQVRTVLPLMPAVQGGKDSQVTTVPGDVRYTRWQRQSGEDCPG